MKISPLLFNDEMMRALLDGRKTQTRRIAKLTDTGRVKKRAKSHNYHPDDPRAVKACPYGGPGDLIWVRETCKAYELSDKEAEALDGSAPQYGLDSVRYRADDADIPIENTMDSSNRWGILRCYVKETDTFKKWVPSIHMPRWASRVTLDITNVRLQRLQDIDMDDARAEGMRPQGSWDPVTNPRFIFHELWDEVAAKAGVIPQGAEWNENPFVWALTFVVHKSNVDKML